MSQDDPHDLRRFVDAQDGCYDAVLAELRDARKRTHWMWFVFPQARGLGSSPTAVRYGIASRAEARDYAAHPVLGTRLRECANLVAALRGVSVRQVFGSPDDVKLRSSMTLFAAATEDDPTFVAVLDAFYAGDRDDATLRIWESWSD